MRIFIIGYMGAGKTTVGKKLANKLGIPFVDLDDAFEAKYRYSIPRFFEHFGEERFREFENQCLKEIIHEHDTAVISTGGGTACSDRNMLLMNNEGTTVYIKMTPKSLAHRLIHARRLRPIVRDIQNDDMLGFVEDQLSGREPFYAKASVTVKGENFDLKKLVEIIESF